ncbi:MAG: transporter substrate-binding domain-containing protein, partial [Salinivirgaceae bacterium]|nr:transporter substrate-binding domain-containing protein [Salinivirgaceae bacterium]
MQNGLCIIQICLFFIIFIGGNAFSNDHKLHVNIQDAEYPYFTFTKEHLPKGFIFELFNNLNVDKTELVFTRDTSQVGSDQLVYGYITENEVPDDYYFIELPHRIVYYVFTRKGANIISLNDLLNKKIIVLKNDLPYSLLYENKASHILKVKSYKEALQMLSSGINDCAIVPFQIGIDVVKREELKNIDYVITPFLSFDFGIAVRKDQKDLINKFELSLRKSIKNNEYKLIEDQWFVNVIGANHKFTKRDKFYVIFIIVLIIIVILIIGF